MKKSKSKNLETSLEQEPNQQEPTQEPTQEQTQEQTQEPVQEPKEENLPFKDEEIQFQKIDLKNGVLGGHKQENTQTPQAQTPQGAKSVGIDISNFLTPRLAIVIFDRFYPPIVAYVYTMLTKKKVPKNINLDESEIEALEPIVEEIMQGMQMKVNPWVAFFFMSNMFYISKFQLMEGVNDAPTKPMIEKKKGRGRPKKENKL